MSEAIAFLTGQPSATAFRMSFPTDESIDVGWVNIYGNTVHAQPLPTSSKTASGRVLCNWRACPYAGSRAIFNLSGKRALSGYWFNQWQENLLYKWERMYTTILDDFVGFLLNLEDMIFQCLAILHSCLRLEKLCLFFSKAQQGWVKCPWPRVTIQWHYKGKRVLSRGKYSQDFERRFWEGLILRITPVTAPGFAQQLPVKGVPKFGWLTPLIVAVHWRLYISNSRVATGCGIWQNDNYTIRGRLEKFQVTWLEHGDLRVLTSLRDLQESYY